MKKLILLAATISILSIPAIAGQYSSSVNKGTKQQEITSKKETLPRSSYRIDRQHSMQKQGNEAVKSSSDFTRSEKRPNSNVKLSYNARQYSSQLAYSKK